jgi:hypothetical protein
MSNLVVDLGQLPTFGDIRSAHAMLHPYLELLKWVAAPFLGSMAIFRAAYGSDNERFAFLTVAVGSFSCFFALLLISRGVIVEGDRLELQLSTASSALFALFPLLLCLRFLRDPHIVSILKETWGLVISFAGAGGFIFLSIEMSAKNDELLSTGAAMMAGAGFTAWALQHGFLRTAAMVVACAMLTIPQLSWYAADLVMQDMLRIGAIAVAIILGSVGPSESHRPRKDIPEDKESSVQMLKAA